MNPYIVIPLDKSFNNFFEGMPVDFFNHVLTSDNINKIKNDSRKKIVVVDYFYYEGNNSNGSKSEVKDLSWADLVICVSIDPLWFRGHLKSSKEQYESLKKDFNNPNTLLIVGSHFKDECPKEIFNNWLTWVELIKNYNYNFSINYTGCNNRPFLFDALLGRTRPHRVNILKKLKETGLITKSLTFLRNSKWSPDNYPSYESPELFDFEVDLIKEWKKSCKNKEFIDVDDQFIENGINVRYGHISPKIYQNSWFSIVAETNYDGQWVDFLTEKTSKCFFAKRIFVCFAQHGHLKNIKELGFKTFDGIIDESYDLEVDPDKRFDMAWSQVEWLSKQNPENLYEQAMPILEHNFKFMMESDLRMNELRKFIKSYLIKL